jgi:hypothetical protein
MIQFLKPRKDRQRHLDVVESAQMPLPDVIDWLAAAAEESGLTDEEAAEIQVAFQQQSATDVVEPDEFRLDFGLESLAASSEPELVEPLVVSVPDPLDLSQIELSEPLLELLPAPVWSDLSRSISVVESPVVELSVAELPVVEPPVVEPTVLAPTLVEAAPLALVDAEALVEIRLDTCAIAALPEAPVMPMLVAASEPAAGDLAIDATPVAALIAGVINELNDIPDAGLAIDDLPDAAATPIDWQNDNWASEAVDVAAVEAAADAPPTSPLSYFQYYLDENAIGEGQTATDEIPAPYVTPWRQPSMPGGLIGAGVLGATLVSGFVIADTVKTQPVTAVKRPPTAPLQSPSMKDQPIAAVPPKVMPPESMKPEVALPKPKSATMSQPIFPPLAPIAQSSYGGSSLGGAIARSSSADLPQSNAGMGSGLSESPTITARRAAPSPVAAGPVSDRAPLRDLTQTPELPAPILGRVTPVEPIRPTLPTPETAPAETPTSELPELTPDISVPQPATIAPEMATPPVTRVTPSVLSELTPDPMSSMLQRVDAANPAPAAPIVPPADVVVPTAAAPVAPIVDQSAALPVTPTPELPAERVFTREAATAPSTMPPVALAQPIADRPSRLPTQAQVQSLLAVPAVNAYVPMVAQWRPLTQNEANVAVNAPKLEGFTRQQLSPQDYRAAYRLVSEQADVLPSFGFIDYQRKLIILPPEPTTASNPIEHSRSFHGAAIIAQRTTDL